MGWLVLSRKLRERVNIRINGVLVEIEVTEIERGRVRLAFAAGPEVEIWRAEIDPQSAPPAPQDKPRV